MAINNFINLPDTKFLELNVPVTPEPTLSVTPSRTPSNTPSISVSPSFTPSHTPTPSISPSLSYTPTPTYSRTPTQTATPYATPTKTPTNTPTISETKDYFLRKNKQRIDVANNRIRLNIDCEVYEEKMRNEE